MTRAGGRSFPALIVFSYLKISVVPLLGVK